MIGIARIFTIRISIDARDLLRDRKTYKTMPFAAIENNITIHFFWSATILVESSSHWDAESLLYGD